MLASLIEHRARPRHVGVAVAVYAPLAVLMFVLPGLVTRVSTACGQPPFDVRGFWDAADAKRTLDACGNTGRAADVAGVVTAVKRVFGFIAFSTPLVLVVTEVAFRVRSRMGEPQRRGGPDHPQESP